MKLNEKKCQHLVFGGEKEIDISIGSSIIEENKEEKLLGCVIDQKLKLKQYMNMLCTKASQKLHALARDSHESFCNVAVEILSINMNVS